MQKVQLIKEIIKYGQKLGLKNMTPGTSGNISVRFDENILISASGTCLADLSEEEIVLMDKDTNVIHGAKPSSEKKLHSEIYKLRPDINAIIHCHSPYVSSFAAAHMPLSRPIIAENVFYFGEIPLAPYAMPSSDELVINTVSFFSNHCAVLLANHGIIIGGTDLKDAYYKMETAEAYAQIYLNSISLGGPVDLSEKDIDDIYGLRKKMGK
jgi:L-fuculose-phosphate aldolase